MSGHGAARVLLLSLQAFIAVTSVLGGLALVAGAVSADLATVLSPPLDSLEGSPFESYLVPGLLLAVLLGGVHAVAFVGLFRRAPWALFLSAVAGYATLIWIFVQMVVIPFSVLQAVYFAAGAAELGLVLVMLGLFRRDRS